MKTTCHSAGAGLGAGEEAEKAREVPIVKFVHTGVKRPLPTNGRKSFFQACHLTAMRERKGAHGLLHLGRGLLRCHPPWWQFQNTDVAKVDLRAFGFEETVAFSPGGLADAVHEFSVDGELHGDVAAHDIVGVPFSFSLAAHLERHSAPSARVVWDTH